MLHSCPEEDLSKKKKNVAQRVEKNKIKHSSLFKIMLSRFKEDARNSHDVGSFIFRRVYRFLCLNNALRKATVHMFLSLPPTSQSPPGCPTVQVMGRLLAAL